MGLGTWEGLGLFGHWGTSSFQPTSQPVSQPADFQTPHALANRSGISASLMRNWSVETKVYLSRSPELDSYTSQRY